MRSALLRFGSAISLIINPGPDLVHMTLARRAVPATRAPARPRAPRAPAGARRAAPWAADSDGTPSGERGTAQRGCWMTRWKKTRTRVSSRPTRWRLLRARVLWWLMVVLVAETAALPVLIAVE